MQAVLGSILDTTSQTKAPQSKYRKHLLTQKVPLYPFVLLSSLLPTPCFLSLQSQCVLTDSYQKPDVFLLLLQKRVHTGEFGSDHPRAYPASAPTHPPLKPPLPAIQAAGEA